MKHGAHRIGLLAAALLAGCPASAAPPALTPCPDTPNCVSTEAQGEHRIAPIRFEGSGEHARQALLQAIAALPRSTITHNEAGHVAAEFRSRVFGFVDAAEFRIDDQTHLIRFRSGARRGHYDFGVNRDGMEALRARLTPVR